MYPLKFEKCFITKIWGGRAFEEFLNMKLPTSATYGESWEVSSHKNGMSYVANGELKGLSLENLISRYPIELLGEEVNERFQGKFPILVKYLDVNDRLSIQVHPSDEYALRVEGEFGKSESWYVMEASADAKLIMGIKEGVTKQKFLSKVKANDFTDLFNIIPIKKGDFIKVKPGLVHATLEGSILICENQQNSDTTYRIYDFDRKVDGKLRELHLDKAADVINFDERPIISTIDSRDSISLAGAKKEELIRCKYFDLDKLKVDGSFHDEINCNFKVYSILEGEGKLIHQGKDYLVKKGDTYFIPAGLDIIIEGKLEVLKSFI